MRHRFWTGLLLLALLTGRWPAAAQPAPGFADPAFARVWARTDKLVADRALARTWFWGPQPNSGGVREEYAEAPGGARLVQYFDKSRMEINNPNGDQAGPFYVTNGRLTVELISGRMAVGDNRTVGREPAAINMSGDPGDPLAPTYAAFVNVANTPLGDHPQADKTGQTITASIDRDGAVRTDGSWPAARYGHFVSETGHNIADVFWTFLNQQGPVLKDGARVTEALIDPWFYASGFPISDPYWARQTVAGKSTTVLIQAFERRVLTYAPDNPEGFEVEMGNIGQHYYQWRYGNTPPPTVPPATPEPIGTPVPGVGGSVQITGAVTRTVTMSAADLGRLPQQDREAGASETHRYQGVLLYDLLMAAGGGGNGGRDLPGRYIIATGRDGKRAVIAWGEIDYHFTNAPILVATRSDGVPLDGLLLAPVWDTHDARYVPGLQKLEVVAPALQNPPAGPLRLTGVPRPLTLTGADLATRPQVSTIVVYTAGNTLQNDTFTGVRLATLLAEAGLATDPASLATRVFLARGDERHAAVAGGELDQMGAGETVLVAITQGGQPICCAPGGSPRLVIASDARGGRFIPHLTQIEVVTVNSEQ